MSASAVSPRPPYLKPHPDLEDLARAQRALLLSDLSPALRHFAFRAFLLRGLDCGSLTAADLVEHAEPAVEALALASSFEDLSEAVIELLVVELGDDPELWDALLLQAATWPGSIAALIRRVREPDGDLPSPPRRAPRWPRGVDAAAVLLTLAPDGMAELFVENHDDPQHRGVITRVLDRGPRIDAFVAHALGPDGATPMRLALARNPMSPPALLLELILRDPPEIPVLTALYERPDMSKELRVQIVERADAVGGIDPRVVNRLLRAELIPGARAVVASVGVTVPTYQTARSRLGAWLTRAGFRGW